jgi:HD-like signal output (HDOD) protein
MGQNLVTTTQALGSPQVARLEPECNLAADSVTIPIKLCNLPPLNAIANQVLALSADPEISLRELSDIMKRDPAFAADVLFLANSSLFGFPQRVHSFRHAAALLGLERIQAVAVTVAMRGFLSNSNPLVRQCWQHSAACALICDEIAPIFGVISEIAYTAGLMHDIGLLGFVRCYRKEAETVLSTPFDRVDQALALERVLLNVDHGRAGAWLVKNWGLPITFAECCEHHHGPCDVSDTELIKVVKAGCRIADALKFSAFRYMNPINYDNVIRSFAKDVHQEMFPTSSELRASVESKLAIFG